MQLTISTLFFLITAINYRSIRNFIAQRSASRLAATLHNDTNITTQEGRYLVPCIRLARGKFELIQQDSAGGKKSSVLTSTK